MLPFFSCLKPPSQNDYGQNSDSIYDSFRGWNLFWIYAKQIFAWKISYDDDDDGKHTIQPKRVLIRSSAMLILPRKISDFDNFIQHAPSNND